MISHTDVAVIGAGAAGLAAGLRLLRSGVRFEVLEAADHVGGRAETDTQTLGTPVDLGCHWLHDARNNPFTPIARSLGFDLWEGRSFRDRRLHLGARYATPPESDAAWQAVDDAFDAVWAAGEAGRDVPARDVIAPAGRWQPLVDHWLTFMASAPPEEMSTRDCALYHDSPDNWAVLDGYGALVQAHARVVPVTLSCPVRRIDRSGPRLRLETDRGTLECGAVVVTASPAVIAGGHLGFFPALPDHLAEAFHALRLGMVEKVALAFDRDVFGVAPRTTLDAFDKAAPGRGVVSAILNPDGSNGALVHVMGPSIAPLLDDGPDAMAAFALEALANVFGAGIKAHAVRARATRWARETFIGGAYSMAQPGKAHLRARLHEGLDGRIFFAGEAVGGSAYSTCHGAHLSGIAAAEAALACAGAIP